jgi:putative DNA primase/helicase
VTTTQSHDLNTDSSCRNETLAFAHRYTNCGFVLAPGQPGTKHPNIKEWQNLDHADELTLQHWFGGSPANVCIVTGRKSGLVVVDVDPRHRGDEELAALEDQFGRLPETATARTGGGGHHYLFKYPSLGDLTITNKAPLAGREGLDVRAEGGQVVAPPSLHPNGTLYEWEDGKAPWQTEIAELPGWLLELMLAGKSTKKTTRSPAGPTADGLILEGGRNDSLFRLACQLRDKGLNEAEALGTVHETNTSLCKPPLDEQEVGQLVRSAFTREARTNFGFDEVDMSRRFIADHGANVSFVSAMNRWHTWSGTHWLEDDSWLVNELMKETLDKLRDEANQTVDGKEKDKFLKSVGRLRTNAKIKAFLALAQSDPQVVIKPDRLDANPFLLNVRNGIIDLRTGAVRPHDPADLITKWIDIEYRPDAEAPTWERFLREIFQGDEELVRYVQRVIGYCSTGDMREQKFWVAYGTGANGKSTFLDTISSILGPYSRTAAAKTFLDNRFGEGIGEDLAYLRGARFVSASETKDGASFNADRVKQITGGDSLTVRHLYGHHFTYDPTFKLLFLTNHRPQLDPTDYAVWRRLRELPFKAQFLPEQQDRDLPAKLVAEARGILSWIVRGAVEWNSSGLGECAAVEAAVREYKGEQDVLGDFIDEKCELDQAFEVDAQKLYNAVLSYCFENGRERIPQKRLIKGLEQKGYEKRKTNKCMKWVGLQLRKLH